MANLQFVDNQLMQLNNEWAVADTARIGYTNALKVELENTKIVIETDERENQSS